MIPLAEQFDLKVILEKQEEYDAANLFGFIAFTSSSANIVKVLRDEDYWSSFDEDSKGWLIFSVKPLERPIFPEPPPGPIYEMVPVWKEPNANKEFIKFFELESTRELPLFIIFAIVEGEIQKFPFRIDDSTVDAAYDSIRNIIKDVTAALNGIETQYLKTSNVLGVIERGVKWPRDNKASLERLKPILGLAKSAKAWF